MTSLAILGIVDSTSDEPNARRTVARLAASGFAELDPSWFSSISEHFSLVFAALAHSLLRWRRWSHKEPLLFDSKMVIRMASYKGFFFVFVFSSEGGNETKWNYSFGAGGKKQVETEKWRNQRRGRRADRAPLDLGGKGPFFRPLPTSTTNETIEL